MYPHTFANNLRVGKGYHTGLFGKCMNGGCNNPSSMKGAFERWFEGTSYQGGTYFDNESPGNKSVVQLCPFAILPISPSHTHTLTRPSPPSLHTSPVLLQPP